MRRIRFFVTPVLALAVGIVAASAASAASSSAGIAKFSVPVSVSVAQGAGGGCPAGICDFGSPSLGVESPALVDDLTITSNDANGFQINGYLTDVTQDVETGGVGCVFVAAHNITPVGLVTMTGAATTGGTGGAGTAAAKQTVTGTAQGVFTTAGVPLATGTMDEQVSLTLLPVAGTPANSANCSYSIDFALVVVAI
jgi:hypothetical protein